MKGRLDSGPPQARSVAMGQFHVDRDHRCRSFMHGADDIGVIDAPEIDRGDREIGVPELTLDDEQRDAFSRQFPRRARAAVGGVRTGVARQRERQRGAVAFGRRRAPIAVRVSGRAGCRTALRPGVSSAGRATGSAALRPVGPSRPRDACRPCRVMPGRWLCRVACLVDRVVAVDRSVGSSLVGITFDRAGHRLSRNASRLSVAR
jgi:hypothetical protein